MISSNRLNQCISSSLNYIRTARVHVIKESDESVSHFVYSFNDQHFNKITPLGSLFILLPYLGAGDRGEGEALFVIVYVSFVPVVKF